MRPESTILQWTRIPATCRAGVLLLTAVLLLSLSADDADLSAAVLQVEQVRLPSWQSQQETMYVQQLLSRGMFDLARHYCERRIEDARLAEDRAVWELMLSDCYRQLAWTHATSNRNSLISLAAERLTEFLQRDSVPPSLELMIRLQQMELLLESAVMQSIINHAAHWYVPQGRRLPQQTIGYRFGEQQHQQQLAEVRELAKGMLDQVNQIRRDLDAETVRMTRERSRLVLSQVPWLLAQFQADATTAKPLLEQAAHSCRQLLQSVVNEDLKLRLNIQAAEIDLLRGDAAAFNLRMPSADSSGLSAAQRNTWLPLHIKGLLRQGRPSEALQLILNHQRAESVLTQELVYLKLESLLAMYELIEALGDASIRESTAAEFQTQLQAAAGKTSGVWQESIARVAARFGRVRQVGVRIAEQLETADRLIAENKPDDARAHLLSTIEQVSSAGDHRAMAAMQLQYGELSVGLSDWDAAIPALQQSTDLYRTSGNLRSAAAADLLRVYAIGRRWESRPDRTAYSHEYDQALTTHVQLFAEQETAATAREWMVRLLRAEYPLRAVQQLLILAESSSGTPRQESWLLEAGELLIPVLASDTGNANLTVADAAAAAVPPNEPAEKFCVQATEILQSGRNSDPSRNRAQLRLQLIELQLLTQSGQSPDWADLKVRLAQIRSELLASDDRLPSLSERPANSSSISNDQQQDDEVQPSVQQQLIFRCDLPGLVANVRTDLNPETTDKLLQSLLQTDGKDRLHAIQFLHRQYAGRENSAGDVLLARSVLQLLPQSVAAAVAIDQQVELLRYAATAAAVTGDNRLSDQLLERLFKAQLSDTQLMAIASILSADPGSAAAVPTISVAARFWKSVLKRSAQGSDSWLEASLQIALEHEQSAERDEAVRILNVIEILYPEWGGTPRKQRAATLRIRLMERP